MLVYVVLDKRSGIPVWNQYSKIFLERNDAIKYFHELMCSDEFRSVFVPTVEIKPDLYENSMLVIKQEYCYAMSLDKYTD